MKQISHILWLMGGFIAFGLACMGLVMKFVPFIPMPTVPFLLLASFCFAKGSERFDKWFQSTRIYEKYLADYAKTKSMTIKQKAIILSVSNISFTISLYFVQSWLIRGIVLLVAVIQFVCFVFVIGTLKT